jgi:hypothetical protein
MAKTRWDNIRRHNVVFIHRTAAEYIKEPRMWNAIERRLELIGNPATRNIDLLLMASYLRLLKIHPRYVPTWAHVHPAKQSYGQIRAQRQDDDIPDQDHSGDKGE